MKRILMFLVVAILGVGIAVDDADAARRFGGGQNIGKQRDSMSRQAVPHQPAQAPAAAPAPVQKPGASKWLGPLAGLAAGVALGSLFSHFGGGSGSLLLLLLVAAGIFLLFRALRRAPPPPQQRMEYAGLGQQPAPVPPAPAQSFPSAAGAAPAPVSSRPAWFEDEPFLRAAKSHFIRLQAAYDRKDLNDIREYTTPEVFAEISLQLQERGDAPQRTDVVTLHAELVDVVTEGDNVVASVRFWGTIREAADAPAEPFEEIWHIQKPSTQPGGTWYVAGIQQQG